MCKTFSLNMYISTVSQVLQYSNTQIAFYNHYFEDNEVKYAAERLNDLFRQGKFTFQTLQSLNVLYRINSKLKK